MMYEKKLNTKQNKNPKFQQNYHQDNRLSPNLPTLSPNLSPNFSNIITKTIDHHQTSQSYHQNNTPKPPNLSSNSSSSLGARYPKLFYWPIANMSSQSTSLSREMWT